MNKAIKTAASVMIIILIFLLVWIFISYYKNNTAIDTIIFSSGDKNVSTLRPPSGEYISNDKQEGNSINNGLIESIIKNASDSTSNIKDSKIENQLQNGSGEKVSGENISEETNSSKNEVSGKDVIDVPDTIIEIPSEGKDIVISSELQTSNQEKQEILSEIDEALQGLLEVVGKVEIVDEDRLDATLDSEVDKP